MNAARALHSFMSQFGLVPYPADNVPAGTAFPYLTYTPVYGFFDMPVSITVNIWYYTVSEAPAFDKVMEIIDHIKKQPVFKYEDGAVLFTVGDSFGQPIPTEVNDEFVKGRTLNLNAEYSITH